METLELKKPSRKLTMIVVEKEYNEAIKELEIAGNGELEIRVPTPAFKEFLKKLVSTAKPDFATEELGDRDPREKTELAKVFESLKVSFFTVDIDENAKNYILNELDTLKDKLKKTLDSLNMMEKKSGREADIDYLVAYADYLKDELKEGVDRIKREVRPAWIVKGIVDAAEKVAGSKKELVGVHVCSPAHLNEVVKILESLGVKVEVASMKKEYVIEEAAGSSPASIKVKVKPVVKGAVGKFPYILFFLTSDDIASPFDVCMAYDAGFDTVKLYEAITPEKAKIIVQDAIFSRGTKGVKYTCFFVSGKDIDKVEDVAEVVKKTMFKPFKTAVVVDPRGAYTTAAAMIAKAEEGLQKVNLGELAGKSCAVFGTGPVGMIAAALLSKLGCETVIAEPYEKLSQAYVDSIVNRLKERYGVNVKGVFAPTKIERANIVQNADVIFTAAAAGVRVIDATIIGKLRKATLFVDINAVPPSGVEGLEAKDDMKEIRQGIYGIGSLAVGDLKYKVEMEMLQDARISGDGFFDYNYALEKAREILRRKVELVPSLTVTVSR
ncbi:MAG: methylene-tetrahydromethanopterin dehydrogenase N-terminal domain-containing protein [Candidatus Freyarchaeota archaeon]